MSATPPPSLVRAHAEGLQLVTPLRQAVEHITVTSDEGYHAADALLARIHDALRTWDTRMEALLAPLRDAKQKADALKRDVRQPLELAEQRVRQAMQAYKQAETARLEQAARDHERQSAAVTRQLDDLATREVQARTAKLRERLAAQREALEATVDTAPPAPAAVTAAHSTTRTLTRWRVTVSMEDLIGLIAQGRLPAERILTLNEAAITRTFRENPAIVAAWPGFEVYDEVIIVGRRS